MNPEDWKPQIPGRVNDMEIDGEPYKGELLFDDLEDSMPACHCGWIHYEGPCNCKICGDGSTMTYDEAVQFLKDNLDG